MMIKSYCVLTGMYDRPDDHPDGPHQEQKTWCGRENIHEWVYQDPTHAALDGLQGSGRILCRKCRDAIVKALDNNLT